MPAHEDARSLGLMLFGPLGVVLAALVVGELACSTPPESTPQQCFSTPECGQGRECSGGACVAVSGCKTDAECGGGQRCSVGACRASCTSNDQCAGMGLECSLATFQCMPKANPPPPIGGSGGAPPGPVAGAGSAPAGGAATSGAGGTLTAGSGGALVTGGQSNGGTANNGGQSSGGTANNGGQSGGSAGGSAGAASGGFSGAPADGTCGTSWPSFPSYMNNNGSVTFYDFSMGSNCGQTPEPGVNNKCVNCSFRVSGVGPDRVEHVYTGEGRYFAAMNTEDFRSAAACGACVEVTRDGNRKVIATVVDQCPIATNNKCKRGHIDLSREAFRQIGSESEGYVGTGNGGSVGSISWRYVPCPVPASQNVSLRLKEQNNEYYTAVRVQDHVFPIANVQIKGASATRDGASNYWLVNNGNQAPGPWPVRVTDVNGWMYDAVVNLNSGDVTTGRRATCN